MSKAPLGYPSSLGRLNAFLSNRGVKERVVFSHSTGHYFFNGGDSYKWQSKTIYKPEKVSDMDFNEWVEVYVTLSGREIPLYIPDSYGLGPYWEIMHKGSYLGWYYNPELEGFEVGLQERVFSYTLLSAKTTAPILAGGTSYMSADATNDVLSQHLPVALPSFLQFCSHNRIQVCAADYWESVAEDLRARIS